MYNVLLTIHVLVTVFLIGIILMQRSANDGMGLSGSSSTSFLSGRAAASAVTRTTAILATMFILTSLCLGIITAHSHPDSVSIIDKMDTGKAATAPVPVRPAVPTPEGTIQVPQAPTTSPMTAPMVAPPANPPGKPAVPRPQ